MVFTIKIKVDYKIELDSKIIFVIQLRNLNNIEFVN